MNGLSDNPHGGPVRGTRRGPAGTFSASETALMRAVCEAVCDELGITDTQRRDEVARRILASFEGGRRAPLYLVHAGMSE